MTSLWLPPYYRAQPVRHHRRALELLSAVLLGAALGAVAVIAVAEAMR